MKEFLIALSLALASSLGVAAETWPARPVRIIVPFPPGSSPDLVARMLAKDPADRPRDGKWPKKSKVSRKC